MKYNTFERTAHRWLEGSPGLKRQLVALYQAAWSVTPYSELIPDMVEHRGHFFGFHDKTPWNASGSRIACHRFGGARSDPAGEVDVGTLLHDQVGSFRCIGSTPLWNWQQGSELQWRGNRNELLFNTIHDGEPAALVVNPTGTVVRRLEPISAVSADGTKALMIDFGRLAIGMPGYGYRCLVETADPVPRLRLSEIDQGVSYELYRSDVSTEHRHMFLTHSTFSPEGGHAAFLERVVGPRGRLLTRTLVLDLGSGAVRPVPLVDCSHYAWMSDSTLIAFCRTTSESAWAYAKVDVESLHVEVIGWLAGLPDGHPATTRAHNLVISDTYPDRRRLQRLLLFDPSTESVTELARLRIPSKFRGPNRCDFHPRWSPDGTKIAFDSAHSGEGSLCVTRLEVSGLSSGGAALA